MAVKMLAIAVGDHFTISTIPACHFVFINNNLNFHNANAFQSILLMKYCQKV